MNFCRSCQQDFGSVRAFDAHRVGKHAYSVSKGLRMTPPREDGRRCLSASEIAMAASERGLPVFVRGRRGAWSLARDVERGELLRLQDAA